MVMAPEAETHERFSKLMAIYPEYIYVCVLVLSCVPLFGL